MKNTLPRLLAPALLAALCGSPRAHAQQIYSPLLAPASRVAWQPVISVGAGEHGLELRSETISADGSGANFSIEGAAQSTGTSASAATGGEEGSRLGRALSDSIVPFGLASGVFLLLDGKNHPGQTRGAIEGVGATIAITELLKYTVKAERPRGGPHSFPSGHASLAFALATAVGENHRSTRIPLYGLATAIAASRVDVRAHYTRDVVAGAAIGYFTTKYFMRHTRRSAAAHSMAPVTSAEAAEPALTSGGLGISSNGISFARAF